MVHQKFHAAEGDFTTMLNVFKVRPCSSIFMKSRKMSEKKNEKGILMRIYRGH